MAIRKRATRASGPVSVAVSSEQRGRFEAEARRRGLGVSPTIRTLAMERMAEIDDERQLARARQWQLARARELVDEIAHGRVREVGEAEIDAIFDEALGRSRGSATNSARAG